MARLNIKKIPGARKSALPKFIAPQLATFVKKPPSGTQWLHELKFDGYRMLCRIDGGNVTIWSRNGKDWTQKFLNVVESVKSLNVSSAILDGEIVIVDAQGRSSFQKLQRAMGKSVTSGFAYQVFDLIYYLNDSLLRLGITLLEKTPFPSALQEVFGSEADQYHGRAELQFI